MEFDYTGAAAILTALGAGTLVTKFGTAWIDRWKYRKNGRRAFTLVFNAINELYAVLMEIQRVSKAGSVLVFKSTNGGGRPTLSGRLYSTIMYEVFTGDLASIKEDWQNQLLDSAHIDELMALNSTGLHTIDIDEMHEGHFKTFLQSKGIVQTQLIKVHERETEYIYICVNFTTRKQQSPELRELYRASASKLQSLFKKHTKV